MKEKLKQAEFIVAWDMFLTDTAKLADVILPLNSFAESEGTYTNSEGQIQELQIALKPKIGRSNLEAIDSLVNYSFDSGFLAI
jgi:predicted molibdopterin-dependent oxidoreductase YjgC